MECNVPDLPRLCSFFIRRSKVKAISRLGPFLTKYQNDVDWPAFYGFCERYHLRKFVDAVTAICVNHLGVMIENPDIVITSANAERIMVSIFDDENSVVRNGGWGERVQIVKNLFTNRWKYKDIYGESIWKQLWYYTTGFLFKTE